MISGSPKDLLEHKNIIYRCQDGISINILLYTSDVGEEYL